MPRTTRSATSPRRTLCCCDLLRRGVLRNGESRIDNVMTGHGKCAPIDTRGQTRCNARIEICVAPASASVQPALPFQPPQPCVALPPSATTSQQASSPHANPTLKLGSYLASFCMLSHYSALSQALSLLARAAPCSVAAHPAIGSTMLSQFGTSVPRRCYGQRSSVGARSVRAQAVPPGLDQLPTSEGAHSSWNCKRNAFWEHTARTCVSRHHRR